MSGFIMELRLWDRAAMKRILNIDTAYAMALLLSALGGSLIASGTARAQASSPVTILSEAQIERIEVGKDGKERTVYKKPGDVIVVPGDKVVFTLSYANRGATPASGFRATNPMPGPVQFLNATEDWAEVSVDGGKSWGILSALTVKAKSADGTGVVVRPAAVEDVTHVRWVFASDIAPGAKGAVSYRGIIK
jgi:uncharacterized repeat protein (TIGR01451 family)